MTEPDPTDIAGQEAARSNADTEQALARRAECDDLTWLLSDKRGRRVMWRLLAQCGVFRNAFAGDPNLTIFRTGEQNIGHWLLAEIHAVAPETYGKMVKEANVRRAEPTG